MNAPLDKIIKIGCASGFWGDTTEGAKQLVDHGQIDYLVFDYLAEITMSLLARARTKNPEGGYVPDFVQGVIKPLAKDIAAKKIKVIANAGGVNPIACKAAIEAILLDAGVDLKVAAVVGDDLMPMLSKLKNQPIKEMFSGEVLPDELWSMNAYLGAIPIRDALVAGADIVVTGRVVDSAVTLGALMYEFGWAEDEFDKLASGSLAGHILECGTQATGGLVTDWRKVADGWDNMGFPITECHSDGSFIVTKVPDTGGLVSVDGIAEQVVYEVGDPEAYILPDVTCDLTNINIEQVGTDRVQVSNIKGHAPTRTYKVSATWHDGYRATGTIMIGGFEAAQKAEAVGEALLKRSRRLFRDRNIADFNETSIEVLGAEATYGGHSLARETREVMLKIAVRHDDKAALNIFAKELMPSGTSMAQGITGFAAGRPKVQPVIRLFSYLIEKENVTPEILINGEKTQVKNSEDRISHDAVGRSDTTSTATEFYDDGVEVPLITLAYGRSGDKGNKANIGLMARRPEFLPVIRGAITATAVKAYLSHVVDGDVDRFEWPGLNGFNFLLHEALGGGGMASLRYDAQGKALAQMLLGMPIQVPSEWLKPSGLIGTENLAYGTSV